MSPERCQCKLAGCHRLVRVKHLGLCHMHAMRYYRHGDPMMKLPPGRRTINSVETDGRTIEG